MLRDVREEVWMSQWQIALETWTSKSRIPIFLYARRWKLTHRAGKTQMVALESLSLENLHFKFVTLRGGQSTGCLCLLLGNMMGNYLFCIHTQILSSTQHVVSSRSLHLDFHPWSDYGTLQVQQRLAWQMPLVLAPPGASVLGWLFKFVI